MDLFNRRKVAEQKALIDRQANELTRLRYIADLAGKLVKNLNDGKVDYDFVEHLQKVLDVHYRP